MTHDAIETLLNNYYAAWCTGDPARVIEHFVPDAIFEDLAFEAKFEGHAGIRAFAELTYAGIPDFEVVPVSLAIQSGPAAAAGTQWVMRGTHKGDLPGFPATGKPFEVRASSIISFRDGLIESIFDYWSPDTFKRSVGLI